MMRRAEEIRQGNAHVKENIEEQRQKASKPKPASRKRRDAERAAARAQQQVQLICYGIWCSGSSPHWLKC